jgi:hypothetical protein
MPPSESVNYVLLTKMANAAVPSKHETAEKDADDQSR